MQDLQLVQQRNRSNNDPHQVQQRSIPSIHRSRPQICERRGAAWACNNPHRKKSQRPRSERTTTIANVDSESNQREKIEKSGCKLATATKQQRTSADVQTSAEQQRNLTAFAETTSADPGKGKQTHVQIRSRTQSKESIASLRQRRTRRKKQPRKQQPSPKAITSLRQRRSRRKQQPSPKEKQSRSQYQEAV